MIERVIIHNYRTFQNLDLALNSGMNIVVGRNESGKSTLLEAISMALTGRIHGQWLADQLNPYWFNMATTQGYFDARRSGATPEVPEILIELYLKSEDPDIQRLRGANNSEHTDVPGMLVSVSLDRDYVAEFEDYVGDQGAPMLLPTEYFRVEWRGFDRSPVGRRPRSLGVASIDTRTLHSTSGVDYHTRKLLVDHVEPRESALLSAALRKARHTITGTHLTEANMRIAAKNPGLDGIIGLQLDQSAGSGWQGAVVPQVDEIPFAMSGQGQQSASKVAIAMSRTAGSTNIVLVEEPENHLSHTRLFQLVNRLEELAGGRQTLVTTHSSFVLNRLGVDDLILLGNGRATRIAGLSADTVRYFRKLSGYDTLRIVLADKLALVEGPADEMILARAYKDATGHEPQTHKIDVVAISGTAFKRSLELCRALDRSMIFLRDNDGKDSEHWTQHYGELLDDRRRMYVGAPGMGATLEPQIIAANASQSDELREVLCLKADTSLDDWFAKNENKTEAALRISEAKVPISYPPYIIDAVQDLTSDWP